MQFKHTFLSLFLIISPSLIASDEYPEMFSFDDLDTQGSLFELDSSVVRAKEGVSLLCDDEGFLVRDDNGMTRVESHDVDRILEGGRNLKRVKKFASIGKFKVAQFDNGQYSVKAAGGLNGGGPVLAWTLYVGTKVGIYGAIAGATAGSVAAVVVTGGAAGPAVAAGANAAAGVAGASVAGLAGAGAAASAGTAAVAGAVGGSAAATAAVGTAVGAAAASGATVGTVEALALAAFAAGLAAPTP